MRVLLLSRYGRQGASSRIRSLQYLPALAARGIVVDCCPFYDNTYLQRYYGRGKRPLTRLPALICHRPGL